MSGFLVDVNLPRHFPLWKDVAYMHQCDLGDDWPDSKIWKLAKENNLPIITKDSDFSSRILFHTPPPKVIHIRLGNMKVKQLHDSLSKICLKLSNLTKRTNWLMSLLTG